MLHVRRIVAPGLVVPARRARGRARADARAGAARDAAARRKPATCSRGQRAKTSDAARRRAARAPFGYAPRRHAAEFRQSEASELPRFGNPAGSGAGNSGFVSTNRGRPLRRDARKQAAPGAAPGQPDAAAALAHRAGHEPDRDAAALDRVGHIGAPRRRTGSTTNVLAAKSTAPAAEPRGTRARRAPPLVRIPDGTPAGGTAGTVNTRQLDGVVRGAAAPPHRRRGRRVRAARPAHRRRSWCCPRSRRPAATTPIRRARRTGARRRSSRSRPK